ncbi:hypothetical protein RB195_001242 [Necator americanus]|uniref:Uncharacterized protein n=1 Tax=Necator americanus TaxID=51031 RepID=A0ABR1DDE4_NECAM
MRTRTIIMGDDVTKTPSRESVGERHLRRPQQAPTEEKFETDLRTTPTPSHLPTLVPNIDYAPRLRNNPFARLDIRKPTVVQLPIPPKIGEAFEE